MRNHRMFNTKIVTDDRFRSLTFKMQALYFQLIAVADDEGFVGNLRMIVPKKSDLKGLIDAGLVHIFSTGPALIMHWFYHNCVKNSHAKPTMYQTEKALVTLDKQNIYVLKNEEENSGNFPPKEKESKEKEIKENKSEEKEIKPADADASGGTRCDTDIEKNFSLFWEAYPKKIDKEDAKRVFMDIEEDFDTVMEGLRHHLACNQWVSDNGCFIPDPKNWLKRKGWSNRPPLYKPKQAAGPSPPTGATGRLGPEELAAIRNVLADR